MFFEERFPTDVNWTTEGGPGGQTNIVTMDSGQEQRVRRRAQLRHVFNAAYNVRTPDSVANIRNLYHVVGGLEGGFRYKDWFDFNSTNVGRDWGDSESPGAMLSDTDQTVGTAAVTGTGQIFQLIKHYTFGNTSTAEPRVIRKPVSGTVVLSVNDVSKASGWTVDTVTGEVTVSDSLTIGDVVKAGYEFDVPVRFGEALDDALPITLDDFGTASITSVPLVELLDPSVISEHILHGGVAVRIGGQPVMNFGTLVWDLSSTGLFVTALPDITGAGHPRGGPFLVVFNTSASGSLQIYKFGFGTLLHTLLAGESAQLYIGEDSGGNAVWRILS